MPGNNFTIQRLNNGFTLLELIVVITIIGILISTAIASYASVQAKSRDARRKSDLGEIRSALVLYFQDFDAYPGIIDNNYPSNNSGNWIPNLSPNYFKSLPYDINQENSSPSDCQSEFIYCYIRNSDDSFTLFAQLENKKDFDIAPSDSCDIDPKSVLGASATLNYCLKSPAL